MLFRDKSAPYARYRIEFHGGEAAVDYALGGTGVILRLLHFVAPAVRVNANASPARAPKEIVNWLAGGLAQNIPQRLFDTGQCAIVLKRTTALRVIVESDLQKMPYLKCITADQIAAELVDLSGDGAIAIILAIGFTPSNDASVSRYADKDKVFTPTGINRQTFNSRDFHEAFPLRFLRLAFLVEPSCNTSWPVADMARIKRSRPF